MTHTVSNIIVMAFSPRNIIGCFLKKKSYKGGVKGTPGPHPHYALASYFVCCCFLIVFGFYYVVVSQACVLALLLGP